LLLRSISKHVKDQNWFAVALDFVIVVIGVAVAMMGQQWLAEGQQRKDMRVAEAALQFDLIQNYGNAKERLAIADCRADTYQLIAEKLLEQDERWTGMPWLKDPTAFGDSLPKLLRSPNRPWGSRNWETGLARGTFNSMDEERREKFDTIFYTTQFAERIQDEIFTLQGQIKVLAVTTIIMTCLAKWTLIVVFSRAYRRRLSMGLKRSGLSCQLNPAKSFRIILTTLISVAQTAMAIALNRWIGLYWTNIQITKTHLDLVLHSQSLKN